MSYSAVVLCGGRSSRMGRDKAFLPFGHEVLVARVVRVVHEVVDEVVVVASPGQPLTDCGRVVTDTGESLGPLAGLAVGLEAASGDRVLLVACDLPLVQPPLLRRLLDRAGDADACVPTLDGVPMTMCAVYARRLLPLAQARVRAGQLSVRGLLEQVCVNWLDASQLRDVDPDLRSFHDCNTPERYRAALALAGLDA